MAHPARHWTNSTPILVPTLLILLAFNIAVVAVAWGWRRGTLYTTEQERIEFDERIVRRLYTRTG